MLKVGIGAAVVILGFLIFISTRADRFHYERSGLINAAPEKIYPYLSDLNKGGLWSPFEQVDPNLKKTFSGPGNQVGSIMEFEGNRDAGAGKVEILKLVPNEAVSLKLTMTKPFFAENAVEYKLIPEGSATRFSWSMEGQNGFLGKFIGVIIDCEAMIGNQFTKGIENLKNVVEKENAAQSN